MISYLYRIGDSAIVHGRAGEETLARAYKREKVDIPRAPELGLLLENVRKFTSTP